MPRIDRRDFLKLIGAGGVGAGLGFVFAETKKDAVELLIPQPVMPEDYSPGIATWYNSVCTQCSAGCGIMVRVKEGRAKKIEGNPSHPVNQGRLCAMGQAGLNALYNPDRIRTPLRRIGEKGSGEFEEISWEQAFDLVAASLNALKSEWQGKKVRLLTGNTKGHLDKLFSDFMEMLGADGYLQYDFDHPANLYAANKLCFGTETLPYYDIRNTNYLLSFGADYLGTWLSPVHNSLAYGHMRQGRPGKRGKFVQIESRMSLSGANADEWVQAIPGTEGLLALTIAHELVAGGYYAGGDREAWVAALAAYDPQSVSQQTGVSAEKIQEIARGFGGAKPGLAIGGGSTANHTNGVANLVAVNVLNYLSGNIGKPGGVIFNSDPAFFSSTLNKQASYGRMLEFIDETTSGDVEALIIYNTNPVFNLPEASKLESALRRVPLVVSLSSFMDETTAMADVVLPTNTYLESWGDDYPEPGVGFSVASISQPVIKPIYDTKSAGDIVLSLAGMLGNDFQAAFPWRDMEQYLEHAWEKIYQSHKSQISEASFKDFWNAVLQAGVWGKIERNSNARHSDLNPQIVSNINLQVATPPEETTAYEFSLQPYFSQAFHDGRGANLPWLQELPDPITGIVYNSWVDINPKTAERMGIKEGDIVEVQSAHGSVQAPAFLYPAIMPDVVAIPVGQGHDAYGRYAKGRGINPLKILSPEMEAGTGALAWAATRVNLRKTGDRVSLIKQSGYPRELGRNILSHKSG
ncbi:MAG: molybdopterin-dependent oxidoreductase [Gammaproteobacteria bacterium]|nr:molybdopterin-dependent oxidoreductase [Gammaproteobacteria bacterium]